MSVVIIEQDFSVPLTARDIVSPGERTLSCMELYGAHARRHYLARGGMRCMCVFEAPDAEAVRSAFRMADRDAPTGIWAATIYPEDGAGQPPALRNRDFCFALVERSFAEPVEYAEVKAVEEVGAYSRNLREVRFVRSYLASSRKRMVCVYEAPDVEAVRTVNRHAGLPFERAWAVELIVH
jgi:hypothetical protein